MLHLKAPHRFHTVFLAGSIEMGKATNWQDIVAAALADQNVVLFNPRRDDWDSTWKQDPTPGTQFHEQVTWELDHIQQADLVLFYFDPNTQSPITLMELGLMIGLNKNPIVCCPDGYYRKGNVVITCGLTNTPVYNTLSELIDVTRYRIKEITEGK